MPTLHLGVVDVPYSEAVKKDGEPVEPVSTGEVAEWLEAKYHVMEHFWEAYQNDIAKLMEDAGAKSLESFLLGNQGKIEDFALGAMSKIYDLFQKFIDSKEMDKLGYPGIPTKASIKGISHRMKNKQGTPGRPSFRDTGTYEAAFKAWIDNKMTPA